MRTRTSLRVTIVDISDMLVQSRGRRHVVKGMKSVGLAVVEKRESSTFFRICLTALILAWLTQF